MLIKRKDNTNSKHLELYSIMAEHDNAGFPLSYCLLSTASAIDQGKRLEALAAWGRCLRDQYRINPVFMHVDKDMAEIGSSKKVWNVKISLCWWHLRRAVRARLAKAKLATTPYNIKRACSEFDFIDPNFFSSETKVDIEDYEGGLPDDAELRPFVDPTPPAFMLPPTQAPLDIRNTLQTPATTSLRNTTNTLCIKLPPSTQTLPSSSIAINSTADKENNGRPPADTHRTIQGAGFILRLAPTPDAPTTGPNPKKWSDDVNDSEEGEGKGRHTFCPAIYRESIIDMMERHYCAHPMIPGYAAPDASAIKRWAVRQVYGFCERHMLSEVWAYLWENWYRKGRWELWACSVHDMVPILKTTMILESQ
jgi:hypothetical protein